MPARGAVLRALLADIVGAGLDPYSVLLTRAVERRGHPPIDRRLDRAGIRPRLLDPELDAQQVADDRALRRLAEVEHGHSLIGILRQRVGRREQRNGNRQKYPHPPRSARHPLPEFLYDPGIEHHYGSVGRARLLPGVGGAERRMEKQGLRALVTRPREEAASLTAALASR